ncbi:unnamed protein product [Pipistrellus nathusii]|uniref:Uncharacterized protein n=1 Tax=Pipistrellus nathusii TaxID=59473 RepID=A0ABP0AJB2_PIPNA
MPSDGWAHRLSQASPFLPCRRAPSGPSRRWAVAGAGCFGSLTTGLVLNLGGSEFFSTSQRCRTLKGLRMKAPGAHGRKGGINTSWSCEKMNETQLAQATGKLVLCGPFPRAPGLPAAPATSRPTWKLSDVRRRGTRQTRLPMP